MTTGYVVPPPRNAWIRGWRAFVRWTRGRPFWGGLLTIVAAALYFYSGHIGFANIRISFSQQEFLGWMIPLILVLCGLLMLFTPAQRIFYGVLASAVSVGGLVGLNLGGFVLGMLVGIVGGALGASWTPAPQPSTGAAGGWPMGPVPGQATAPDPATGPDAAGGLDAVLGPVAPTGDDPAGRDMADSGPADSGPADSGPAGGGPAGSGPAGDDEVWRRSSPARAAPDPDPDAVTEESTGSRSSGPLADTLPASMVSPLGVPARTTAPTPRLRGHRSGTESPGAAEAGTARSGAEQPGTQPPDASSPGTGPVGAEGVRSGLLRPGVEQPEADEPGGNEEPPPSGGGTLPRRSPRGLAVILVLLTVAAVGATTVRPSTPADAAPSCAELLDSLIASASPTPSAEPTGGTAAQAASDAKSGAANSSGAKSVGAGSSGTQSAGTQSAGTQPAGSGKADQSGSATAAGVPSSSASPRPSVAPAGTHGSFGAVLGVLEGLGRLLGIGDDTSPEPTPSASPTPSNSPTAGPRPTATSQPTAGRPTGTPKSLTPSTHSSPPSAHPSGPGRSAARSASASPSSADCPVGSTDPVPPLDQTVVAVNPAEQITALLEQLVVTYRGVTALPTTDGGTVRVLQFTMASSSSTPFELRVPMVTGNRTLSYKSTRLTVSGHVTFYTSRLSGNLLGVAPVNWTPDTPPPLPPIPILGAWFTNAMLDLVLVHADKLTAPALRISYLS